MHLVIQVDLNVVHFKPALYAYRRRVYAIFWFIHSGSVQIVFRGPRVGSANMILGNLE